MKEKIPENRTKINDDGERDLFVRSHSINHQKEEKKKKKKKNKCLSLFANELK